MRPWLPLLLLSAAPLLAGDGRIWVGEFSKGVLAGWQEKQFAGRTEYRLAELDGRTVLAARSHATASGLFRELTIDLERTPYLHWSWRVDQTLGALDERSKQGDDYPARVYVVFSGGVLFWRTRALNYVWSSSQAPGSSWPNAFTDHARMIALRGAADAGGWVQERRNVREDFRRVFGAEPPAADAVAIMTDSDNSGASASAYYGDIYFAAE